MVSFQDADGYLWCGGSIVASDKIVTAAHCFPFEKKKQKLNESMLAKFQVVAGTATPFEPLGERNRFQYNI